MGNQAALLVSRLWELVGTLRDGLQINVRNAWLSLESQKVLEPLEFGRSS